VETLVIRAGTHPPYEENRATARQDRIAREATLSYDYIPQDSAARKRAPMATGLLDYFSAALFAVAEHSHASNEKHNPGEPLHWSRNKSGDHADCIARHLVERGGFDNEGRRHSASLAWRALALLQEELEAEGAAPSRASRFVAKETVSSVDREAGVQQPALLNVMKDSTG
jgi:hypothetical protein